jgi:transposase-like protein
MPNDNALLRALKKRERQYAESNRTPKDLARDLDVGYTTLRKWLSPEQRPAKLQRRNRDHLAGKLGLAS